MIRDRLKKRFTDPNLVLIYQYGKVGSTSLADSIPGAVNVHTLYATALCPFGFRQRYSVWRRWFGFPLYRVWRRFLIRRRTKVDIIVPLRAPWERNISMYFQDLPFWYVKHFATKKANQKTEGLDLIKNIFHETFDHDGPDRWFQEEFCRLTGVDLNEIPFDKSTGFCMIEKGRFRCLLLTTDHLRRSVGAVTIRDFLGRPLDIKDSNRGERKWYASVYQEFLNDQELIDSYKERMASSKVHKKFFE